MQNIDHLSLDGRSLYMLKQIHEHRSVTAAARIMGVTQSTVSHSLERLRGLLGDPLFIKSGRSMVPTERAEAMIAQIDEILAAMQTLHDQSDFQPEQSKDRFSLIANDFEHELLVPPIMRRLQKEAPMSSLRTHLHHELSYDCLEKGYADAKLCPYPPQDAPDLVITPLCDDKMITYYDPAFRDAPRDVEEYAKCSHAILSLGSEELTSVDAALAKQGLKRHVAYIGPSFSAVATAVKGSNMLATAPSRMANTVFRDFAWIETPVTMPVIDFYMIWHVRHRHSPRHKWFRQLIKEEARNLPILEESSPAHMPQRGDEDSHQSSAS